MFHIFFSVLQKTISISWLSTINNVSNFIVFREFSRAMLFNATFNNISAILWRSVLLVEKTGVYGENH